MTDFFTIAIVAAMLAALASLGVGLFAMVRGGDFNRRYANLLMRLRVGFQGLAILLLLLGFAA